MKTKLTKLFTLLAALGLASAAWAESSSPVYLVNMGGSDVPATNTDSWKTLTSTEGLNFDVAGDDGVSGNFKASSGKYWTQTSKATFTSGTSGFVDVDGTGHNTVFGEMITSLGLTATSESELQTMMNTVYYDGANAASTITIRGLDSSKTYVLYFIACSGNSGKAESFTISSTGCTGTPTISYVTGTGTSYSTGSLGTQISANSNVPMAVRVSNLQPTSANKIIITTGATAGNILALAEYTPMTITDHTATASGTCSWSTLADWNPAWANGANHNANLTVGSAATTLTIDETLTAGTVAVTSAAGNDLTLALGSGITATVGTYDFSGATGTTTVNYGTGTSPVKAGSDTVLTQTGTGALTVAAGNKATFVDGATMGSYTTTAGSYYRWNNTTAATLDDSAAPRNNSNVIQSFNNATVSFAGDSTRKLLVENGDNVTIKKRSNNYSQILMDVRGGTLTFDSSTRQFFNAPASTAILTMTGGLAQYNGTNAESTKDTYGNNLTFGWSANANMAVNISGGTLSIPNAYLHSWEGPTYTVTGTGKIKAKGIWRRDGQTVVTAFNVNNGGEVSVGAFGLTSGNSAKMTFTINEGGIFSGYEAGAFASHPIVLGGAATIAASNDVTFTISSVISGSGSLTKDGAGTVSLTGANTYTGATTVNCGTLDLPAGQATGDVTLKDNTVTLNITGTEGLAEYVITEGTFTQNGGTVLLNGVDLTTAGYKIEGNEIVTAATGAAMIGSQTYETVAEAFAAVQDNETVALLKDCDETLTATATTFTLALGSHTLSGSLATVANSTITLTYGTGALSSTVTGSGTLVCDGYLPDSTLQTSLKAAAWTGTVWLKNKDIGGAFGFNNYCNSGSKIKVTGIKGYGEENGTLNAAELILEDENTTVALTIGNGYTKKTYSIAKMSGTGTFKAATGTTQDYVIADGSAFAGSIDLETTDGVVVIFGDAGTATGTRGLIQVASGKTVTVASGKTWQAHGGIQVYGTLNNNGTLTGTVTGSGTVVVDGSLPTGHKADFQAAAWTGTVWIKNILINDTNKLKEYGNDGSKIKVTGVMGYMPSGAAGSQGIAELVLADNLTAGKLAFELDDSSSGYVYNYAKFTGDGSFKFATKATSTCAVTISDVSEFTGRILSTAGTHHDGSTATTARPIYIGTTAGTASTKSLISVADGATIRSGCGWEAAEVEFGATVTIKGAAGDVVVSNVTTSASVNTVVTLVDPSTDAVLGEYTLEYANNEVKVGSTAITHLGWDAAQTAWTNGLGAVVSPTAYHVLDAKAGDNITFSAAVTACGFNMPETGTVTINNQDNLTVGGIAIPSGATLVLGSNAAPGFSVSGTGTLKYGTGRSTEPTVVPVAKLAGFSGTFWMTSGRHRYNTTTPIASTVTLKVTDGAQLMLEASSATTWNNKFILNGEGWGGSGNDVEYAAVRVHDNVTIGNSAEITFITENDKKGSIGMTADKTFGCTLKGTDGFNKRGGGTMTLGAPKTQAANLSGNIIVTAGTLRIGNGNNSGCTAGNEVALGTSSITVNSGAAVAAWCWTTAAQSALATDKVKIMTPITLNGGSLNVPDGAHAFMGAVTVNGTSSGTFSYHKGWYFGNLIIPAGSTFNATLASEDSYSPYFTVAGGDVDGTLNVTNNGGGTNKEMHFCVTGTTFANGALTLNSTTIQAYIDILGDTTLGTVSGNVAAAFGDGTTRTLTLNGGTYGVNFKDIAGGKSDTAKLNLVIAGDATLNGSNTKNVCSGTLTVNADATLTPGTTNSLPCGAATVASGATLDVAGLRGVNCGSIAGAGTVAFAFTQAEAEAGSTPVVILAPATDTALTVPADITFSDGSHSYTASVNADGALTVLPNEHLVVGAIHATLTADTAWGDIEWLDASENPIGTGKDLSRTTTATLTADAARTVTVSGDVTMNNITVSGDNLVKFVSSNGGKLNVATAVINGKVGGDAIVAAAMTVADGAEIDTRYGTMSCTGAVTFSGTTKVRVSAMPTAGGQVAVVATPGTIGASVPTLEYYVGDDTTATALPAGVSLVWGYGGLYVRETATDNAAYTALDDPATKSRNWIWFDADCGSNLNSDDWENRSLPIGNGRIGASVMENRAKVRLALNENSFWSGGTNKNASSYTYGPKATKDEFGNYQPFGDFFIEQPGLADGTIKRALDLTTGVAQGEIVSGGVTYTRRTYASRPAQVVATTLEANKLGAITGKFSLWPDHTATVQSTVEGGKGVLKYSGTLVNGMNFAATAYVIAEGGAITVTNTAAESVTVTYTGSGNAQMPSRTVTSDIFVDGATKVTVVIAMNTDYVCSDADNWVRKDDTPVHISATNALAAATLAADEATMRAASVNVHKGYFDTCDVYLGAASAAQAALPTPTRLSNYKSGTKDTELEATLFQMGRYLLIGSSGDALPANLQGLWNDKVYAPWASDYHNNINIQENYWPAEVTGLSDLHLSLFNWMRESLPTLRKDTAANFKCYTNASASVRGWTTRVSQNPFGAGGWTQWNTPINAWYALHYWEHYQFTMDEDFLRDTAYPFMKEAAEFWCDYLKPLAKNDSGSVTNFRSSVSLDADQTAQLNAIEAGTLVSPYGWSHEHGPNEDGVTFDQQLIRNLFNNTITAAQTLGVDADFIAELTDKRSHLATNAIGKGNSTVAGGYLQEWLVDRPGYVDTTHRHTSHLMAVYPCCEINLTDTPELAAAAANSLLRRGEVSDSRRSWTWPWRGALWARLGYPEKAHDQVEGLLKYNTLNNLWTTHTPYQIDGNLSYPAAVAEMLLQSQVRGEISLLPGADTAEWPEGRVTGLRARGAITVDFTWSNGKVTAYELHAATETPVRLQYNGITEDVVAPCAKTILETVTTPSVGWKGDFTAGTRRGYTLATDGVTVANGLATIATGALTVTPPTGNIQSHSSVFTAKMPASFSDNAYLYGLSIRCSTSYTGDGGFGILNHVDGKTETEPGSNTLWAASSGSYWNNAAAFILGTPTDAALHGLADACAPGGTGGSRFSVDGVTRGGSGSLRLTDIVDGNKYVYGGKSASESLATGAAYGSIFIFRGTYLTQDELNLWTAPAVGTFQHQKHVELSGNYTLEGNASALSIAATNTASIAVADGVTIHTYGGFFANSAVTIDLTDWTAPGTVITGPIYSKDNITVTVNPNDEYDLTDDGLILTKAAGKVAYSATIATGTTANWDDIEWKPTGERAADADYILTSSGSATLVLPAAGATVGSLTLNGKFVIKAADAAFTDGCWVKTILTFGEKRFTADDFTFAALPSGFEGKYVVTDTAILLYAQNKEVISINIAGGRGSGAQTSSECLVTGTDYYGLAPVPGNSWMNLAQQWDSVASYDLGDITGYIGTKAYAHAKSSGKAGAKNTYTDGLSSSPIIHGYLDDGTYGTGTNAWISVTGIPYSEYDVIVYASTDSSSNGFRPVTVNGTTYTTNSAGVAVAGDANWGTVRQTAVAYGVNAMIVKGLTDADLTVFGGNSASSCRGGIAAIQIVCTGYVTESFDFTADIEAGTTDATWDNGEGTGLVNQSIDWVNSPEATITLTNYAADATLTLDTDIVAKSFKIVSAAGCNLTIVTNGTAQLTIAAYDFTEAAGAVTYDMAATAAITVGATTTFTEKADPIANLIIPNGVHFEIDDITVTQASGRGELCKTGSGTATLLHGTTYKSNGSWICDPAAIVVEAGKLVLSEGTQDNTAQFFNGGYTTFSTALRVTGGTLDLNNVFTYKGNKTAGWITDKPIVLGSGAVITNGNVTLYSSGVAPDEYSIRYLGGDNHENEPATFAANIHSTWANTEKTRTIYVEDGAGEEYDLLITGDIGITNLTPVAQYATSTVYKAGAGTLKNMGERNFPGLWIHEGKWIVAGPVNSEHAANAFIQVDAGATIDYATPDTMVLLPTLRGYGTVTHTATGMAARLKFGDTLDFFGTLDISEGAYVATPTPVDAKTNPFTVTGKGTLLLMLTKAQRGYIEPYQICVKAGSGFTASQITICDENGAEVTDHVARVDSEGNIWFDPAGDTILYWDDAATCWTNAAGKVVAENEITTSNILAMNDGDNVNFGSVVTPLAVALPSSGMVTVTNGFNNLGLATIGMAEGATLKVQFPALTDGDVTPYAITNQFTGAGTLELALASDTQYTTSLPVSDANFPSSSFTGKVRFSAGQFKALTALASHVGIEVVDNAQLYLSSGSTWHNHFWISGNGYHQSSARSAWDCTALRVDATIASDATITPVDDGVTDAPAIGSYYDGTCNAAFNGSVGVRFRCDYGTLTLANPANFAGYTGAVTIENGNVKYGNASQAEGEYGLGSSVSVESGATLQIHLSGSGVRTITTPFTLNGGTLKSNDGGCTIPSVTVAAASAVTMAYGETITFTELHGSADLTLGHTSSETTGKYVIGGGDYSGTITGSSTGATQLQPTGAALQDATVILNASMKLVTDDTTVIKLVKMGANNTLQGNAAKVNAGTTLDMNGTDNTGNNITLNGGSLVNNGSGTSFSHIQVPVITVTDDSTIGGSGEFAMIASSYNATTLALNDNTLTKIGANTLNLISTTVSGSGTLAIDEGEVRIRSGYGTMNTTCAAGTFAVGAGAKLTVDSGKVLSLHGLTLEDGCTLANSGTITNLAALTGDFPFASMGGKYYFADAVSVAGGIVKLTSDEATDLAGKTVTVASDAIFDIGANTNPRTMIIDKNSAGRIYIALTDDEYEDYLDTTQTFQIDLACNATAAGDFNGFFNFLSPNETDILQASWSIVDDGSGNFVIRATRPTGTHKSPFSATLTASGNWTDAAWTCKEGHEITATDWNVATLDTVMTLSDATKDVTLTADFASPVGIRTNTIVNAGTLRIVKPDGVGLTFTTVDDSASTGATYLPPTAQAFNLIAGENTIMTAANKGGTLTVASNKMASVYYPWNGTLDVNAGGYLKYVGTATEEMDLTTLPQSGATVELAGTATIKNSFASGTANTKIIVTGTIATKSGDNEMKLANNANSVFEVAGGTLTVQGRVMPNRGNTASTVNITGGTVQASGSGFWYVGGYEGTGSSTLNISAGSFTVPWEPYSNGGCIKTHVATVNVSGTGVFAPTVIGYGNGTYTATPNWETEVTDSKHSVNLTGGEFRMPAGVPNWLPINVNGDAKLGLQSGVSRGMVLSTVTIAEGKTLEVNVPAGQTNEFNVTIAGTGNIRKTGDGILMFRGAMPDIGLTIEGGAVGFKVETSTGDMGKYIGGVLALYRSDSDPAAKTVYIADFSSWATEERQMLTPATLKSENGKVVASKFTFPIKPTATGAFTTTTGDWVDSANVEYDGGFDHKVASIVVDGTSIARSAWTNDVTTLEVGTLTLTHLDTGFDMANASEKTMAFDQINLTDNDAAVDFHFDTGAAAITVTDTPTSRFYGNGSGAMSADADSDLYFVSYSGGTDYEYSGAISGACDVYKEGTGRYILSGTNTYTGTTTVNAGTLAGETASAFGTGALTVADNTAIEMVAGEPLVNSSVTVQGDGIIRIMGAELTDEQFKITTGSLTLPREQGQNITPYLEVGYGTATAAMPDGKWVQVGNWVDRSMGASTVHDVLWENIYGQASNVDKLGGVVDWTLNFSVTNGMNSHVIGEKGRVKVTKIRFAARPTKSEQSMVGTTLTLTQDGNSVTSLPCVENGEITITKTDSKTETRAAMEFVFEGDYQFKTYQNIALKFSDSSHAGLSVVKPANSTFNYGSNWTPVIEVTGDYTTWEARTFSINFGTSADTSKVTGEYGVVPSDKWRNMTATADLNGLTVYASDDESKATLTWYSDPVDSVNKESDSSFDNLMKDTLQGNGTGWIKLTGIPFLGYQVIIYQQNFPTGAGAGKTYQFNPPAVNGMYYSYDGSLESLTANDPALLYGKTGLTTPVEGANGNVIWLKDAFSGDLYIKMAGNATHGGLYGGIAAIQVVERTDISVHYATITNGMQDADGKVNVSALTWTPAEPDDGFSTCAILNVTNEVDGVELVCDRPISAARVNFFSEGALTIGAITDETCRPNIIKWDSSGVEGLMKHAGNVRSRVEFKLGEETEFAGTYEGKILSVPDYGYIYYTKPDVSVAAANLAENIIVNVDNGSIGGDFAARAGDGITLYEDEGDQVTLNLGDTERTLGLGFWLSGGRVNVSATDRTTLVPGCEYYQMGGYVDFAAAGAGTTAANSIWVEDSDETFTMTIGGGTTDVSRTTMLLGGNTTINISDGALLVKNVLRGNTTSSHAISMAAGGTIYAPAGGVIDVPLSVVGAAKIGAGDGATLFVKGDVTGGGNLTLCNEGTGRVVFMPSSLDVTYAIPTGAYLGYCETDINQNGTLTVPTPNPASTPIAVFKVDGTTEYADVTRTDAGGTTTLKFDSDFSGKLCWWDYEFDGNTDNNGTADATAMDMDNNGEAAGEPYTSDGKSLYFHKRPYRSVSAYPATSTFVFYGTMPSGDASSKHAVISFGSNTKGSNKELFYATGDSEEEIVLMYHETNVELTKLVTLTVPNNTTHKHLYAVQLATNARGNTTATVYLDGVKYQPYEFKTQITLGEGFQMGSLHGGIAGRPEVGDAGYSYIVKTDPSAIDWLRVYDKALSDDVLMAMAARYPYVNDDAYYRDFSGETNPTWDAKDAWLKGDGTVTNLPPAGADLVVTNTAAQTVMVNVTTNINYATLKLVGGGTLTVDHADGCTNNVHVSGMTTVDADIVTKTFALDFNSGNVNVMADRTVTFDMSGLNLSNYVQNAEICLAGYSQFSGEDGHEGKFAYVMPVCETNGTIFGRATVATSMAATGHYHLYILARLVNAVGAGTADRNGWTYMTDVTGKTAGSCWQPGAAEAPDLWSGSNQPDWPNITLRFDATNGDATVTFDKSASVGVLEVTGTNNVTITTNNSATVTVNAKLGWYDFSESKGKVTVLIPTGATDIYLGAQTELLGGSGSTGKLIVDAGVTAYVTLRETWEGTMSVGEGGQIILVTGQTQTVKSLEPELGSTLTVVTNTTADAAIKVTGSSSVNLAGVYLELAVADTNETYDAAGATYNMINAKEIKNLDMADISAITNRGVWNIRVETVGERQVLKATKAKALYVKPDSSRVVADQGNKLDSLDIAYSKIPGSPATAEAAVTALNAEGKNGMKVWESIVLGYDSTDEASRMTVYPKQTSETGKILLYSPPITVDATTGAAVIYSYETSTDQSTWDHAAYPEDNDPEEPTELALPSTGVKYFKLKATISTQGTSN